MRIIQSFDPSAVTSGQITTQTVNPCSVVVLFNHSLNGLSLTLPGGDTANLPPWYFRYYYMPLPGNIQWARSFQLATSGTPVSLVTGEVYEPSEAASRTFTEGPLPLSMNVGNTVNTTGTGSSNTLQNDNNASATQFIESTVTGSPGSNIIAQNQGMIQVLQWVAGSLTQIFKTDPGASSVVKLANTGLLTEVLGNLQVDGSTLSLGNSSVISGKSSDATQGNIFGVDSSGNTFIEHHAKNNQTIIYDKNGATLVTVDSAGSTTYNNNTTLKWKDSGGTARSVFQVNNFNQPQLFGITGQDQVQILKSDGTIALLIDTLNKSLDIRTTATTITGTTAGSATIYEFLTGANLKAWLLYFNGYQNNSATEQRITLPVAFTTKCLIWTGNTKPITSWNGGSINTNGARVATSIGAGGFGMTIQNAVSASSYGEFTGAFDQIGLGTGQVGTTTEIAFGIGF